MTSLKNVLVIGSGGREHAICWKLKENKNVSTVYAFPGSHAIAQLEKVKVVKDLNLKDFQVGTELTHAILSVVVPIVDANIIYPQLGCQYLSASITLCDLSMFFPY